jgi:hypothetical protein
MGLEERVSINATMIWFAALAFGLMQTERGQGSVYGSEEHP